LALSGLHIVTGHCGPGDVEVMQVDVVAASARPASAWEEGGVPANLISSRVRGQALELANEASEAVLRLSFEERGFLVA
jgi:hypothetical protein